MRTKKADQMPASAKAPARFQCAAFAIMIMASAAPPYALAKKPGQAGALAKPLVLQYEVSHTRNTDQISLIFHPQSAELVTNTSSFQKEAPPRLGRFKAPLAPSLKALKERLLSLHASLRRTIPFHQLLKGLRPSYMPHETLMRLGGREVKEGSPHFSPLFKIIREAAGDARWICVRCASYQKKRGKIYRVMKGPAPLSAPGKGLRGLEPRAFSFKELSCHGGKPSKKMECLDPEFGTFEL